MATQQSTVVTINVNTNAPFTPEMLFELQQSVSAKLQLTAVVIPNPTTVKLVEVTSETADQDIINSVEAESTMTLMQLLEAAAPNEQ